MSTPPTHQPTLQHFNESCLQADPRTFEGRRPRRSRTSGQVGTGHEDHHRVAVVATLAVVLTSWAMPAHAEPTTTVKYPAAAAATRLICVRLLRRPDGRDHAVLGHVTVRRARHLRRRGQPHLRSAEPDGDVGDDGRRAGLTVHFVYLGHQPPCTLRAWDYLPNEQAMETIYLVARSP